MKKYSLHLLILASLSALATPVSATDLVDIYNQALQSDQVYQAAHSTMMSQRENLPQQVATLLPNLSATANTTANYTNNLSNPVLDSATGQTTNNTGASKYNSQGYTVTLTQPIINFTSWMNVRQYSAVAKSAESTFAAAGQDLIIRVAKAYFAILQAKDNLDTTHAQEDATARRLDQEEQRFKVGLDAITSVYDAKAQHDKAVADGIAAENTLRDSLEALRQLTGNYYTDVESFKIRVPLLSPKPENIEQWVAAAEKQNLTLQARKFDTQAARSAIKSQFGGHLPTLSAVGTYGRNKTPNNSDNYSLTATGTAGLQLAVPLFSGGAVASQVRQAQDNYATASANMEDAYRSAVVTTRQKYNDVMADISKIQADQAAVFSAQSALDSTEESYKVGTRTIVDVLLAQQTLYQNKQFYTQDLYTYLNDTLLLKQAAGSLTIVDLENINAWLHDTSSKKAKTKKLV